MGSMGFFTSSYDKKTGRRFYFDSEEQKAHDETWKKAKACGLDNETADLYGRFATNKVESKPKYKGKSNKDVGILDILGLLYFLGSLILIMFIFFVFIFRAPLEIFQLLKYKTFWVWFVLFILSCRCFKKE